MLIDLRRARLDARPKISLRDLAEHLRVSVATVGHYETGIRPLPEDEAFLRRWMRFIDFPGDRLVELLAARHYVRYAQDLEEAGASVDHFARVLPELWNVVLDLSRRPRPR